MREIAITGIGAISAAGGSLEETLAGFEQGRANAGDVSLFPTTSQCPVFEVKSIDKKAQDHEMRTMSLALCAVREALLDAELDSSLADFRVGVCLGTTVASQLNDIDFYRKYRAQDEVSMRCAIQGIALKSAMGGSFARVG